MEVVDNLEFGGIALKDRENGFGGDDHTATGPCSITGTVCPIRRIGTIKIPWPRELHMRRGSPQLLSGITILHDFQWPEIFGHNRAQFRNGKRLTSLARKECPDRCQPVVLLTTRSDVRHRAVLQERHRILVVNIESYLAISDPDAAEAFFAGALSGPITELADLHLDQIIAWTRKNPEYVPELQSTLDSIGSDEFKLSRTATSSQDVLNTLQRCPLIDQQSVDQVLDAISNIGVSGKAMLRKAIELCGSEGIGAAFDIILSTDGSEFIKAARALDSADVRKVNCLLGIATCRNVLSVWDANKQNDNEEFWQRTLTDHSFLISQLFATPVVVVRGKAYVGGKGLDNSGGKIADFLCRNTITENAALVEIKTPTTPLLASSEYRSGVFPTSTELNGATIQILDQKDTLTKEYRSLIDKSDFRLEVFDPKCVVIAGNSDTLAITDKLKCFELYRKNLNGVEIVTFDELFERIEHLVEVLETGNFQLRE